MAKTEIVKLEAKLRDHERSLSLYSARIKIFEEKEHTSASNRLHGSPCSSGSCNPSHSSPTCRGQHQQHLCQSLHSCTSLPNSCQVRTCSFDKLEEKVSAMQLDMGAIKTFLSKSQQTAESVHTQTSEPQNSTAPIPSSRTSHSSTAPIPSSSTSHSSQVSPLKSSETGTFVGFQPAPQDMSISSQEEFIPSAEQDIQHLNSLDLTNQLT